MLRILRAQPAGSDVRTLIAVLRTYRYYAGTDRLAVDRRVSVLMRLGYRIILV